MANTLITGSNGQLGQSIKAQLVEQQDSCHYFFTDKEDLDITNREAVETFVSKNNIQIIVNCAAYTNVDQAENDQELADILNYKSVEALSEICVANQIFFIHISTDYVFSGSKNTPYVESDAVQPIGVYGKTKAKGEQAIIASKCQHIIIRTSWLYSSYGKNFLKTIFRLSQEKEVLKVVFDQVGTPTYADDLATFIKYVIEGQLYLKHQGIYHFSNEGVCSWYDFACIIDEFSEGNCNIQPCLSDEFPSKMTRPSYSVLNKSKLKADFNYDIPYWRDSAVKCLKILTQNGL